jgi:prephenate dehydrogenase
MGAIQRGRRISSVRQLSEISFAPSDLVVLALPIRAIRESLRVLPCEPLIIDVGSTKETILTAAEKRGLRFVGGHPIAGSERAGPSGGDADLFRGQICLILPARGVAPKEIRLSEKFWRLLGARVTEVPRRHHDRLFASISHLPHLVAFALVSAIGRLADRGAMARYSLGGLKDTTRIAASPPEMWVDIFHENRREVLTALRAFRDEIARSEKMIRGGGGSRLRRWLRKAQRLRLGL